MAKDKNKTGRTPQNEITDRDRRSKSEPADEGSPKPSGGTKHKSDRDSEGRFTSDSDAGTPKGGSTRGGQMSSPDRNSQRIDDDDEEADDMDYDAGTPKGTPRNR